MAGDAEGRPGSCLKQRSPDEVRVVRASGNEITFGAEIVMSKNTTAASNVIPFRSAKLLLVDFGGQPFVPMKPVVEGMGLDWKTQYRKLQAGRFESTMVMMTIVAEDGKLRDMACMPLRKLAGWLMSIHASKVRPELRDGVIAYQNECDDALWSYWNDGVATRKHDRDLLSVVSELVGVTELSVLKGLIRDKAKAVPAEQRQSFQLTMHSRLHTRFNVPRTEMIPASEFEAACNFIGSYVLEGEYLGREPAQADWSALIPDRLRPDERYLVSPGVRGAPVVRSLCSDTYVLTVSDFVRQIGDSSTVTDVHSSVLLDAIESISSRLRGRIKDDSSVSFIRRRVAA